MFHSYSSVFKCIQTCDVIVQLSLWLLGRTIMSLSCSFPLASDSDGTIPNHCGEHGWPYRWILPTGKWSHTVIHHQTTERWGSVFIPAALVDKYTPAASFHCKREGQMSCCNLDVCFSRDSGSGHSPQTWSWAGVHCDSVGLWVTLRVAPELPLVVSVLEIVFPVFFSSVPCNSCWSFYPGCFCFVLFLYIWKNLRVGEEQNKFCVKMWNQRCKWIKMS